MAEKKITETKEEKKETTVTKEENGIPRGVTEMNGQRVITGSMI